MTHKLSLSSGLLISQAADRRPVESISVVESYVSHEQLIQTFNPSLP